MKRYDVWFDKINEVAWSFKSLPNALDAAIRGPYLVTERVHIGDPRLEFVEDLAETSSDDPVMSQLIKEAQIAIEEADALDFYRSH